MRLGYARVSTAEQNLESQIADLKRLQVERIYCDKESGRTTERPELKALLRDLRCGDVVVLVSLDRLGRSVSDLLTLAKRIEDIGADLVADRENLDTSTAAGKLFFNIRASFAQYESDANSERTKSGMKQAELEGRLPGRPAALTEDQVIEACDRIDAGASQVSVARELKVSRTTLYRHIRRIRDANESSAGVDIANVPEVREKAGIDDS